MGFAVYLTVMAGVTYLVRMLPLVLVKNEIKNKFILSFLHYIPYAVLGVMTVPAIFYSTSLLLSASIGCAVAVVAAYFERSLLTVAVLSCTAVLITELVVKFL